LRRFGAVSKASGMMTAGEMAITDSGWREVADTALASIRRFV
jgi:hypothetical protein